MSASNYTKPNHLCFLATKSTVNEVAFVGTGSYMKSVGKILSVLVVPNIITYNRDFITFKDRKNHKRQNLMNREDNP